MGNGRRRVLFGAAKGGLVKPLVYIRARLTSSDYYRLADGFSLTKRTIEDEYLKHKHLLKPRAYFILYHLLKAQNSVTATAALYSKHYKRVSYDEAMKTIRLLLRDLSTRFIVERTHQFARRKALDTNKLASFWTILKSVGWCQWPLFSLLSLFIALSLSWLSLPFLPEGILIFLSLLIGTTLHEFGHYWPLASARKKVILLAQRGKVSVVYPSRLSTKTVMTATLAGPLLASGFGLVLGMNTLFMKISLQRFMVVPVVLLMAQGLSLLFGQQDGRVLQTMLQRKRLHIKEVDMKTLVRKLSMSLAVFLGMLLLFTLVGFIFVASIQKGYVGTKSLSFLGMSIIKLTANGQGFELSNGPGYLVLPLLAAILALFVSIVLEKTISKTSSNQA